MGDSLRDALLRSGLVKPASKGSEPTFPRRGPARGSVSCRGKVGSDPGSDLARAWSLRKQAESAERKRARAAAEAEARERKVRMQRLREVLRGKTLNRVDAEIARHFEYGGRIRRVYVDTAQLAALNAGRLAVVQLKGGYVLVTRAVAEQVREFAPQHVALLASPDVAEPDDGVPDDLTW